VRHAGDGNIHLLVFQPSSEQRRVPQRVVLSRDRPRGAISGEHGIGTAKQHAFLDLEPRGGLPSCAGSRAPSTPTRSQPGRSWERDCRPRRGTPTARMTRAGSPDHEGGEGPARGPSSARRGHLLHEPWTSEMHSVAALDDVPALRPVLALFRRRGNRAADGYGRMSERPRRHTAPSRPRPRERDRQPAQRPARADAAWFQHRRRPRHLPQEVRRPARVGHRELASPVLPGQVVP